MDPESSLPYSQASVTCLYPKPGWFSPCAPASFFKIHNNIILPFAHRGLLSGLSPQLYTTRNSTHFPFSPMPSTCPTHPHNKNIHFAVFVSLLLPSPSQGHNMFHAYKKDNRSILLFSNRIKWINILKRVHYNGTIRQTKQIPFMSRSL
jgi:hypothetical protein